mgnify:CR=1 FL=1
MALIPPGGNPIEDSSEIGPPGGLFLFNRQKPGSPGTFSLGIAGVDLVGPLGTLPLHNGTKSGTISMESI